MVLLHWLAHLLYYHVRPLDSYPLDVLENVRYLLSLDPLDLGVYCSKCSRSPDTIARIILYTVKFRQIPEIIVFNINHTHFHCCPQLITILNSLAV